MPGVRGVDPVRPDEGFIGSGEPSAPERINEGCSDRRRLATKVIAKIQAALRRTATRPDRCHDDESRLRKRGMETVDDLVGRDARCGGSPLGIVVPRRYEDDIRMSVDRRGDEGGDRLVGPARIDEARPGNGQVHRCPAALGRDD